MPMEINWTTHIEDDFIEYGFSNEEIIKAIEGIFWMQQLEFDFFFSHYILYGRGTFLNNLSFQQVNLIIKIL